MSTEEVTEAKRTVARHILAVASQEVEWDSYPEIGENDWRDVCDMLDALAPEPEAADYHKAYDLLAARADDFEAVNAPPSEASE